MGWARKPIPATSNREPPDRPRRILPMLLRLALLAAGVYANGYNTLFENLMWSYNKLVRPVANPNDTIQIEFKLRLAMLVDVQEKDQVVTTNGWLRHHWFDYRFVWEPVLYGGIDTMHIPGEMIWLPDVILYNNANGSPSVTAITKAHIRYDGRVTWEAPVIYDSFCTIDIEWYPYDLQRCELKFGSWTYGGSQLDLIHPLTDAVHHRVVNNESVWEVERGIDITEYQESVEWDLLSVIGTRHEKWYPCCDYPVIDITYYLHIRRKKLFYTVNLIIPCASLAALTSWVFYLPCESHQKIQLCISILVSLTVFFLLLAEIIPPTSLVTPLIVKYLTFTMLMVGLSVMATVTVQNVHFRTSEYPMSPWMRRVFIDWLGRLLLISRKTEKANFHRKAQHNKQINALSAMSILERQFQKTVFDIEMATKAKKPLSTVNSLFLELPMMARSKSVKHIRASAKRKSPSRLRRLLSTDLGKGRDEPKPASSVPAPVGTDPVRERLRKAEKNVHYIAQTLTERRKADEAAADWQFVSLVFDRILLIFFVFTITGATLLTLLSAPSITDNREALTSKT